MRGTLRIRPNKNSIRYDPVGPVAAMSPWNFPALLPARKIAPAFTAGCSVVHAGPSCG